MQFAKDIVEAIHMKRNILLAIGVLYFIILNVLLTILVLRKKYPMKHKNRHSNERRFSLCCPIDRFRAVIAVKSSP